MKLFIEIDITEKSTYPGSDSPVLLSTLKYFEEKAYNDEITNVIWKLIREGSYGIEVISIKKA